MSTVDMIASRAEADLQSGRRVLRTEAEAIEALAAAMDDSFALALDLLMAAKGRVVVTGIGKSGHVGRKIAATFASTGTPAFFVHPAEASHGDLGMITEGDAVLALSNSGETAELGDVVSYTRRYGLPLVALTSRADSSLAQAADVALILPAVDEACPMGLAPTTSTTLMLALGDALAVTLLERRGFSAAEFRAFHPGGQLGRRLSKVADLMHAGEAVPLAPLSMIMSEALVAMTAKSFGCIGVTEASGRLVGVVTDGDLRRHMGGELMNRSVGEVMTRNPKTVPPNLLAVEALAMMNACSITSLFVVEAERPVGILHIHDCLRARLA